VHASGVGSLAAQCCYDSRVLTPGNTVDSKGLRSFSAGKSNTDVTLTGVLIHPCIITMPITVASKLS
jgi:hypothetical protein